MSNCRVCNTELTDANWFASLQKKNSQVCRSCCAAKSQSWRENNRERANELARRHVANNPESHKASCQKTIEKLRQEVFAEYGGKCQGCGIDDPDLLDIDHISNNGAAHRKIGIRGRSMKYLLKREGFPKDNYQLLCKNCNWKKEILRRRSGKVAFEIFQAINQVESCKN